MKSDNKVDSSGELKM